MKTKLFLTLFCSILIIEWCAAQSNLWQPLNSGTTTNLREVFFTSRDTGYAVGEDSVLLKTVNGGQNWVQLLPVPNANPGNMNAIWMFTGGYGMVAPEYQISMPWTFNGGSSWVTASGPGNPCFPDGLYMDSFNDGFVYGKGCFGGTMIAHWNGSAWGTDQMLYYGSTPAFEPIYATGMAKDPATNAYVVVTNYGKIFRSANAFQSWDTVPYNDTTAFTAVDYAGNNTFYAVSSQILNSVYISTDGGQTFAYDVTHNPTFYYSGFYDVDMLDNGFGVTGGYSMTTGRGFLDIRHTSGWGFSYEPVDHIIRGVCVVDSTLAFAVGDSGAIYRYSLSTSLGMDRTEKTSLSISPNPSSIVVGTLDVKDFAGKKVQIEVQDIAGRTLLMKNDSYFSGKINIDEFTSSPGTYMLRISSENKIAGTKLIITN